MYRDRRFRFVLPAALAIFVPLAVYAQAPGNSLVSRPATAPKPIKTPLASNDVTGTIPGRQSARLIPSETAPPPQGSPLAPAMPDATLPAPAAPAAVPAAQPGVPAKAQATPAAPTKPPLTGFARAIKTVLDTWPIPEGRGRQVDELRFEHKAIADYYAGRDYAPLWVEDGKPVAAVAPIKARLALAGDDALNLAGLPQADFSGDADHLVAAEIAFSEEVVAYGRQASGVRIDPQDINPLIGAKPDVAAPGLILGTVAAAGLDGGHVLQSFNPQQKAYLALRAKLVALRQEDTPVSRQPIPRGQTLRLGMTDPRVPLIRARLGLDVTQSDSDLIYDPQVAAAVADYQRSNGLHPSGVFTQRTQISLTGSTPPDVRNEIIANMEAWRWMPRDLGQSRIDVNIPDYEVRVVLDGTVVAENKVIVGKPDTPTPIFSNTMKFLIVNPSWNIPPSIIRKEVLPHLARDPYYLQRMGYEAFYFHGRLMVRQPPGEKNALGRIKFMFPNQYSVYLHDTPQRRLFAATKRDFSHGCVRVDQPFDFAENLLGPKWPEDRLKQMIGGKEHYVFLPRPLPIHIEYFTAYVNNGGHLVLRDDVYGYEHLIEKALGLAG
jgi:murein L,D-transpeptidase YcbB/YkuD